MLLSDRSILEALKQGRLVIRPFDPAELQPASADLHLDHQILAFDPSRQFAVDLRQSREQPTLAIAISREQPFILHPGEFVLGSTKEQIELAADLVARLEGKSSLGRLGLVIHSTAGFVDPGWQGKLTLELSNRSRRPIVLYRDLKIAPISFMELTTPAARPYGHPELGSRYQGQTAPTASRL